LKTKHSISYRIIGFLLIQIFILITTYFILSYIQNSVKNDTVFINKIGQVRGGIQKDAKIFLFFKMINKDRKHDAKIERILNETIQLSTKSFPSVYQAIIKIKKEWQEMEVLMHEAQSIDFVEKSQIILDKSEEVWNLADSIALEIQKKSEIKQERIQYVYYLIVLEIIFLIYMILMIYRKVNKILESKSSELDLIFNTTPDITFITSGEELIKANKEFFEFTGYENLEKFKEDYHCICEKFEKRKGYLATITEGKRWSQYVLDNPELIHKAIIIKDDVEHIFTVSVTAFTIDNSVKYVAVMRDITELEKVASTDMLTQLDNRKKTDEFIRFCIEKYKRTKEPFSIIILDIDFFKEVNDTYGHDVGDEILKVFSNILSKNVRTIDHVGRWGGEEFMIVCTETDCERAKIIAEKLRIKIEENEFEYVGKRTASFGVTEYDDENMSFQELYMRADKALYAAKNEGRNMVKLFKEL
jgi:diguanylate cyclase (GGDEF)-like protein